MRVSFAPTLRPVQAIMKVSDCLATLLHKWGVTLHPNIHFTVVQAVISRGVYGLKCSACKQIRVY